MPGLACFLVFTLRAQLPGIVAAHARPEGLDANERRSTDDRPRRHRQHALEANRNANAPVQKPRGNPCPGATLPNYSAI
jgi:hypothetical protein